MLAVRLLAHVGLPRLKRRAAQALDKIGAGLFPNAQNISCQQPVLLGPQTPNIPNICLMSTVSPSGSAPPVDDINISQRELIKILNNNGYKDTAIIGQAFLTLEELSTQEREQKLKIAFQLAGWHASPSAIAAALLKDAKALPLIGKYTEELIDNVNKLNSFHCDFSDAEQREYYRDLLYLTAENHDVLLIIAAEDMAALIKQKSDLPQTELRQLAEKAFHVTSAHLRHLGLGEAGGTLEELAFIKLDPEKYRDLKARQRKVIGMSRADALIHLDKMAGEIGEVLELFDLPHTLTYRVKRISSMAKKLEEKGYAEDVNGIRIILDSNDKTKCYETLSIIQEHLLSQRWEAIRNRLRDYIAYPKRNGYRSLHIDFTGPEGFPLEIQIRTKEMHWVAEFGSANHASYKSADDIIISLADPALSLREVASILFWEKHDRLKKNGVFVVYDEGGTLYRITTQRRDKNPTVLDFAFARELNVGLSAVRGKIDGQHSALNRPIESAQSIAVQTDSGFIVNGRSKMANSRLARTVLEAARKGTINAGEGFSEKTLRTRGLELFEGYMSSYSAGIIERYGKHFTLGHPRFAVPIKKLAAQEKFSSVSALYITLALLEEGERIAIFEKIRQQIEQQLFFMVAMKANKRHYLVELMVPAYPQIAPSAINLIRHISGVKLKRLEIKPVRGTRYQHVKLWFDLRDRESVAEAFNDPELVHSDYPSESGEYKTRNVSIALTIDERLNEPGTIEDILEIFRRRGQIISADFPPRKNIPLNPSFFSGLTRGKEIYARLREQGCIDQENKIADEFSLAEIDGFFDIFPSDPAQIPPQEIASTYRILQRVRDKSSRNQYRLTLRFPKGTKRENFAKITSRMLDQIKAVKRQRIKIS